MNKEQAQQAAEEKYPILSDIDFFKDKELTNLYEGSYDDYLFFMNKYREKFIEGTQWQSSQTPAALPKIKYADVAPFLDKYKITDGVQLSRMAHAELLHKFYDEFCVPQPVVSGGEKMYRWVKASDRLPNVRGRYFILQNSFGKLSKNCCVFDLGKIYGGFNWDCGCDIDFWLEEVSPSQLSSPVPNKK